MAHDIFISYSSKDKSVADAVCSYLEKERIRCWIAPRDVTPGNKYAQDIMDAIRDCRVMVVIFSSSANESEHVSAEIERAMNRGSIIIPFRIEDVTPTGEMEYYLGSRHWLDALTAPMEQHIRKLVLSIQTILGSPAPAKESKAAAAPEKKKPAEEKKRGGRKPLIAAGIVLLLLIAGALLFRNSIFPGRTGPDAADRDDGGQSVQAGAAAGDSSEPPAPSASQPPDGAPSGNTEKSGSAVPPAKNADAEIADTSLIDGWAHVVVENGQYKGDVNVVVKGYDADKKIVSLETILYYAMAENEVRDLSVVLGGTPASFEAYIVKAYDKSPEILEYAVIGDWARVVLANGGEKGTVYAIVKGFGADNKLVAMESLTFYEMSAYQVMALGVPVDGAPASLRAYVADNHGEDPAILEAEIIGGWANVILSNGKEPGDCNVTVKGFDAEGKDADLETLTFFSMTENEVRTLGVPLGGNSVRLETTLR